ncbi:MAG: hydroxyacid dehydrogenase [Alphaproteobacteria bacterium]
MKIVVCEFMDEGAVETLRDGFDVIYDPTLVDQPDRILQLVADADGLIVRNRTQVRQAVLDAAPKLKCVGRLGVGLDNIDVAACKARDIAVYPATGANDLSVAEYAVTMALVLLRGAYFANADMIAGAWPRGQLMGREISGKILGLIGYGAIARETAVRARALGMTIVAHDPYLPADDPAWGETKSVSLADLAGQSDVVSIHVPLTDGTRHLVGADFLSSMKPGAVVINAARGGVVDEAALADALRTGTIAGAALDVFETEPLTADAAAKFQGIGNLILTPHVAGVTQESNVRVSYMIADAVRAHLNGT